MLEAYYPVLIMILLLTLPLGSMNLVYSTSPDIKDYSPLEGLSDSGRRMAWFGAVMIIAILVVLCIFKPEDIADREMYRQMYEMGGGDRINRDIEPSFGMLTRLAPNFLFLLGIYALLSVSGHIVGIFRNSPNIWLSLLIYLPYTYVLHDLIQIRSAVAIGLMLVAVRFICERNWILYFLMVALACFFHYTAIVFVMFYFLPTKSLNKWIWSGVLLIVTIGGVMNSQFGYIGKYIPLGIVQNYFESYMGAKIYEASGIGPMRIFKVVCAIIMLFNLNTIKSSYPLAVPVMVFYIASVSSYMLLSDIPVLQGRFGEMFGAFDIYALAMFPLISRKYYYLLWIVPISLAVYSHMDANQLLFSIGN